MAPLSKQEAARRNGAKSKRPKTPEGKAQSSQNARKHGLCASFDVLPGEAQPTFDQLLASLVEIYHPEGAIECELVRSLAIVRWRLRRIPDLESSIMTNQLALGKEEIDDEFSEIGDLGRLGFVFQRLSDRSQAVSLLIRYEASLSRVYDRTSKHLRALQKLRNEPISSPTAEPQSPSQSAGHDR
jgi:hypothetical protein